MNSADEYIARKDSVNRVIAYNAARNGEIEFIESPGHGWAKVPVAWVDALDLIVSRCSPYTAEFIWLEEDCDLRNFAAELQNHFQGNDPDFKVTWNSFKVTYVEDVDWYWEEQDVRWGKGPGTLGLNNPAY